MENLIKFVEDKITDKMSVEEIVDVFEQMCSTPVSYTHLDVYKRQGRCRIQAGCRRV